MQHLFSPEGESALARTLQNRPLLAFDFDGTLAPIVARPNDASLSMGVANRLAKLATHLPVAIVTGRSVADVRIRLNFEPTYIVGNHGAEDAGNLQAKRVSSQALDAVRTRVAEMKSLLESAGVTVEDKGHSIAFHYRLSRTRERAFHIIAELLADQSDTVRVFGGKMVVNVVPNHAPDKADAVRDLVFRSGASSAIFAGDDLNDEPVFESSPAGWLTIRVGRDDRHSKAQFFLDSPAETALLLERMATLLALQ